MAVYRVPLLDSIRSIFKGYNYLIMLIDELKILRGQKVVFDFKEVVFIDGNLSALLGTMFEILISNGNSIEVDSISGPVESILIRNGFLFEFRLTTIMDSSENSIAYKSFTPIDDVSFRDYITTQLITRKDFPVLSKELQKKIVQNIFEIYENARTHGLCEWIHTCGQFYPTRPGKPLYFTIVDKGINIKENVAHYLKQDISAKDAIEWAMVKGNSTKIGNISGGLGLAIIFEFIELNQGKIQVISSDGYYEYSRGKIVKKTLNYVFDGTVVNIKFNFSDTNKYYLKEEEENFDNIF